MADGTVKILTILDNSGIEKGVAEMNSKVSSAAEKAGGLIKKGLKVSAGAFAAVAGGIGAVAAKGIAYNSQMEQLQASYTTMLGSASKATQLIGNLKDMAAKTPFETSDLAHATQTLLSFGVSSQDVMKDLKMLGDVSQGNKEKFDSLSLAFAQITANGKLQGQDLLQLVNAGFNPLQVMAKKTGKSMAELRDEMSKGGISAQDVTDAFKAATSQGGQFYNAMNSQSKTFNGQISTLKDNTNMFLGDLTKGLQEAAKNDALPKVNKWMDSLNSALKSGGTKGVAKQFGTVAADAVKELASKTPEVVKIASSLITSFNSGIRDNAPQIAASAVAIGEALVKGIAEIAPTAAQAAGGLLKGVVQAIAGDDAANAVQGMINSIGNAFATLQSVAAPAIQAVTQIIAGLSETISQVAEAVMPIFAQALSFVAQNLQTILPIVVGVKAGIEGFKIAKEAAAAIDVMTVAIKSATVAEEGEAIAAGVATGGISLLIGAVVGVGASLITAGANAGAFTSDSKKLENANKGLNSSFESIGSGIKDFTSGVQSAKSNYNELETAFGQSQQGTKVNGDMQALQSQINAIVSKASSERRALTNSEVKELEVLTQKEAEATREKAVNVQKSVTPEVNNLVGNKSISNDEYKAKAQQEIKTAQDAAQKVKDANHQVYLAKVKNLDSSSAAAQAAAKAEEAQNQQADAAANATTAKLANEYLARNQSLKNYSSSYTSELNKLSTENKNYNTKMAEYTAAQKKMAETHSSAAKLSDGSVVTGSELGLKIKKLQTTHTKATAAIINNIKGLNGANKTELSNFLGIVSNMSGGFKNLDAGSKKVVANVMKSYKELPADGKKAINDMLSSMGYEIDSNNNLVQKGKDGSKKVIASMDEVMKNGTVSSPKMDKTNLENSGKSAAQAALAKIKADLEGQDFTVHEKVSIESEFVGVRPMSGMLQAGMHASGGIENKYQLTTLCEEGYPEAIIPFNPSRRQRALELYAQTGRALGVLRNANGGIYGSYLRPNAYITVGQHLINSIAGWGKINTGKDDNLSEKTLEEAQKTLDNLKQYDELSTAEEVRYWEKVKSIHSIKGSQINEVDHKIYEAKKANSEAIISDAEKYLEHYKNLGTMTDDWEISYWERTLKRSGLYVDQKKEIDEKLYALKKQKSEDLVSSLEETISHSEAVGDNNAQAELDAWQRLSKSADIGGKEYLTVLEKIYAAKKKVEEEAKQQSEDNYNYFSGFIQDDVDFGRIDTKGQLKRWQSVLDDYNAGLIAMQGDQVKQIKKTIYNLQKEVTESATNAQKQTQDTIKSRANSLKTWTGLFDEPQYNYETSKEELQWNLQEQLRMMKQWQSDLGVLQSRGISDAMLKDLEQAGPASADKIHLLTEMTSGELLKYSEMYNEKSQIATGQAMKESGVIEQIDTTAAQIQSSTTAAVTSGVNAGMNSLSASISSQLPTITELFKTNGKEAGEAYGNAFYDNANQKLMKLKESAAAATASANAEVINVINTLNAAEATIDKLNGKLDAMQAVNIYQQPVLQADYREIARGTSQYMGTYMSLNGGQ